MTADTTENPEFKRWLKRFGVSDAYQKWQKAEVSRAPSLALIAIASEADLLHRVPPADAKLLAHDADLAIGNIQLDMESSPHAAGAMLAAELVELRIETWRRRRALEDAKASERLKTIAPPPRGFDAAMTDAVVSFPQLKASNARFLVTTVEEMGVKGLTELGGPKDTVLALGSTRVAVRSAEGRPPGFAMPRYRVLGVLQIVQNWSVESGQNPFILPTYAGHGDLTRLVSGLAVDASACVRLAAELPGGAQAPGFAAWEDATEILGYALLRLRRFSFSDLNATTARAIASAGGRLARRAIDDPSTLLPVLPDLPVEVSPDDPYALAVAAHAVVNGPFAPRLSPLPAGRGGSKD